MAIELRPFVEKRNTLHTDMQAILDAASGESRNLTAEESTRYDALEKDFDAASADLTRFQGANERERILRAVEVPEVARVTGAEGRNLARNATPEYREAFRTWMHTGETRTPGAALESRAMGIGTGSGGGFLVPSGFYNTIVETMKTFGTFLNTATVVSTASGQPLPIPTMDDTGNEGAIVAENASIGAQDAALGSHTLGAYKFTSKMINVSYELLQDASAGITLPGTPSNGAGQADPNADGIEAIVRNLAGERIGRVMDHKFATGSGTSEPTGLMTSVATGKTGLAGQTTSIIYDDLIDLIHSVDKAYRGSARFVANDLTIAAIRKLKDTQGHPLWQPSIQVGVPDSLLGYPVDTNNFIAAMGVSAKSLVFGDIRRYYIRMVEEVIAMRLVERYADLGQVAFFVLMRADGFLMDTSAVKVYVNSAT